MQNFYRIREEQPGVTKAEALHRAQKLFIRGETHYRERDTGTRRAKKESLLLQGETFAGEESFTPDPRVPYAHPYYWSPFILMGNWL